MIKIVPVWIISENAGFTRNLLEEFIVEESIPEVGQVQVLDFVVQKRGEIIS
jgi:hypothetical protein